jgi:hypothetical protein
MFFLLEKNEIRASQYLPLMVLRASGQSSGGRILAVAANSGPVILLAHGTRGDPNLGVVSDAFVFTRVTAGHHIKLVIFFAEPDRSVNRTAILAERAKRYVFLAPDFRRNRHSDIVRRKGLECVDAGDLARVIS